MRFIFSVFGSSTTVPVEASILAFFALKSLRFAIAVGDSSAVRISVSPQIFITVADDASMSKLLHATPRFMTEADDASIYKSMLFMRFDSVETTLALPISIFFISEQ